MKKTYFKIILTVASLLTFSFNLTFATEYYDFKANLPKEGYRLAGNYLCEYYGVDYQDFENVSDDFRYSWEIALSPTKPWELLVKSSEEEAYMKLTKNGFKTVTKEEYEDAVKHYETSYKTVDKTTIDFSKVPVTYVWGSPRIAREIEQESYKTVITTNYGDNFFFHAQIPIRMIDMSSIYDNVHQEFLYWTNKEIYQNDGKIAFINPTNQSSQFGDVRFITYNCKRVMSKKDVEKMTLTMKKFFEITDALWTEKSQQKYNEILSRIDRMNITWDRYNFLLQFIKKEIVLHFTKKYKTSGAYDEKFKSNY